MTDRRPVANRLGTGRLSDRTGHVHRAYGLAWLGGGTILGALHDYSITALITFTIVIQALALLLFVPLLRHR
ncbi:MAG: hypothetical protein M3Y48_19465 [Actinomycetota bacterium]|nr:hypothetical protein [Actinomycetota bacterium]